VNFLLDTNLVSEWTKGRPDPGVIDWLADADEDRVFVSVLTLAELRHGVERLAMGRRRKRLSEWIENELLSRFDQRILPIDAPTADAWGRIVAHRETLGRPIGTMDAFIAATAQIHKLTLATRNQSDFESSVDSIVNPWSIK
jgi:predicted nucleic acid-binding protein